MKILLVLTLAACGENVTPAMLDATAIPACVPNRDGRITADELPIAIGARAAYYASPAGVSRQVDLAGDPTGWRLADERPDDVVIGLGPVELSAQWYAEQFPNGRFVVDAGGGLDAIYHQDDAALWLDGTASQAASQTLIRYADPVALLRFPLVDGEVSTTTAQMPAATINGLPFIGTDEFTTDVTGRGHLQIPYLDFSPVLRVRTKVVRAASGNAVKVTKRTTLFMFECFGEVARAESLTDETNPDFTTAAYLRRFALGAKP